MSVLFTNTRTRWPHNEREIFNTARGVAECSIENFEFIVLPASACICKQNTNLKHARDVSSVLYGAIMNSKLPITARAITRTF